MTPVWMWLRTGQISGFGEEQDNCPDVIKTRKFFGRDREQENCLDVIESRTTVST
jgi:hypothetical protein